MYDLIIIGAGPAGITATVYAARKKMDFLVISGDIGGQAAWSGDIENYTGSLLSKLAQFPLYLNPLPLWGRGNPLSPLGERARVRGMQRSNLKTISPSR